MTDTALIQQKLGVQQTDVWNQPTESAVTEFQRSKFIDASGNPDPVTLAALNVYDPAAGAPASFQRYVAGGPEPGTYGRDVTTAMNQIPRWAWITMAVGFGGLAYFAWYRRKAE